MRDSVVSAVVDDRRVPVAVAVRTDRDDSRTVSQKRRAAVVGPHKERGLGEGLLAASPRARERPTPGRASGIHLPGQRSSTTELWTQRNARRASRHRARPPPSLFALPSTCWIVAAATNRRLTAGRHPRVATSVGRVDGWETWQRQTDDGAVESEQRVALRAPVVEFSAAGAEHLGRAYWREVERFTRRVVRARERMGSLELRLFGNGPTLLRFGRPEGRGDRRARILPLSDRRRLPRAAPRWGDRPRAGRRLGARRQLDDPRLLPEPRGAAA